MIQKIRFTTISLVIMITLFALNSCGGGARSEKPYNLDTYSDRRDKLYKSKKKRKTKGKKEYGVSRFGEDDDSTDRTKTPHGYRNKTPQRSGLRAGFENDNKQFNLFLKYLKAYKPYKYYPLNVVERIQIKVRDRNGKSLPNCKITIRNDEGDKVYSGRTYSDGSFLFFPSDTKDSSRRFRGTATYQQHRKRFTIDRYGKRKINVRFGLSRGEIANVALDIVFVLDTTGSMGEEIARLKATIDIIHLNVTNFSSKPDVRFGMVLYRDKGDSYRTKVIPLTDNLDEFKSKLNKVNAEGGGDAPEDLQEALKQALTEIEWREGSVKLAYVITDAMAHLDYGQSFTYAKAARKAKRKAIKLFTIGTGGLGRNGEYILRQIAQYTSANYIFLHYGEKGESEGGRTGSVSHHTGANYQVSKLETLVIRLTKQELSHLTDKPIKGGEEYFLANKVSHQSKKDTLQELFSMAVNQLIDYSSIQLDPKTPASVLPIASKKSSLKGDAEYYTEQLILSTSRNGAFKLIDRSSLDKILKEQAIQGSDLFNEKKSVKIGKLVGAKLLIISNLYSRRKKLEMIVKLIRVETGEILSVSKVKISKKLRA